MVGTGAPMPRPRPLRVLHLSTDAGAIAGAERLLLDVARCTDPQSTRLHFAFLSGDAILPTFRELGVEASSLGMAHKADPRILVRWRRLLRRFQPDIVHTHLFHGGVFGFFATLPAWARGRVRLVHSRHYDDYNALFATRARYELDKWVSRRFDHVLAVSDAVARQLIEVEGVRPDRVTITRNGVDADHLAGFSYAEGRAALAEAGVPADPSHPVVLCAATFREQKGHAYLIEAWKDVRRRVPTAELVLLGVGHLLEPTQALARGVPGIHFLGYRPDAFEVMAGMDLYVQPSIEEGFGLALVEAMAMGKAALASEVGGMQLTLVDGETGRHVPPRDVQALADALVDLLLDDAARARMGAAGAARAREHFSVRRMVAQFEEVYDRVTSP